MAHVAEWKKATVSELVQSIVSAPVVGMVDVSGIPGPQLQEMRGGLRGKANLRVTKNNLIQLALAEAEKQRPGIGGLSKFVDSQMGLVTAEVNPFKLFKDMEKTKTASPAKGGETAPEDIDIKAGDTPFKPGPIVGELQKVGIPAAIEQGKVVIKKDKTLVKEGEKIPAGIAKMLTRLEIFPLTVGLNLKAAFEGNLLYDSKILAVDEVEFMGNVNSAISGAFNLACFVGYATPLTIRPLLGKAKTEAFNLAMFANVLNTETVKFMLPKAQGEMLALASRVPDALDDELKQMLGAAAAAAPPVHETKKDDDDKGGKQEEEEEVSEEEAAAGLGALFG